MCSALYTENLYLGGGGGGEGGFVPYYIPEGGGVLYFFLIGDSGQPILHFVIVTYPITPEASPWACWRILLTQQVHGLNLITRNMAVWHTNKNVIS